MKTSQVVTAGQIAPPLEVERSLPLNSVQAASCVICMLAVVIAILLFRVRPGLGLLPIALVFGWTQVASPCGTAISGAFTSLANPRRRWRRWLAVVTVYTLAGLLSSAGIGAALGWVASLVRAISSPSVSVGAFAALSLILAVREAGWVSFPLPQASRPSVKQFAAFGQISSGLMWGLHIGLGFSTWMNYGGPYALIAAILLGLTGVTEIRDGALLMSVYWLGRAMSAWMAPCMVPRNGSAVLTILGQSHASGSLQRLITTIGLACCTVGALVVLLKELH
jgi:hypothetical protein